MQPHAHYLAARGVGQHAPDGTEKPLIFIRDWEFDWQGVYHYAAAPPPPRGHDAEDGDGLRQSDRPTRGCTITSHMRRGGSPRAADVRRDGGALVPAVTRQPAGRDTLANAVRAKVLREEIVGHEKMLEWDPGNVALHDTRRPDVRQRRQLAGMIEHFAAVQKIRPDAPAAQYNYGLALLMQGRAGAGAAGGASALAPDYARVHRRTGRRPGAAGRTRRGALALSARRRTQPRRHQRPKTRDGSRSAGGLAVRRPPPLTRIRRVRSSGSVSFSSSSG